MTFPSKVKAASAVPGVPTSTHVTVESAGHLSGACGPLRLLGSHAILTGIRASVAQTLVGLGVELNILETRSTLQSAIAFALRHTGESLVIR